MKYYDLEMPEVYLGLTGVHYMAGKGSFMVFSASAGFDNFTVLSIE